MGLKKQWSEWLRYRNQYFDIDLTIWERFPNDIVPTTYPAKYELDTIRQNAGNLERRYLIYRVKTGRGPFRTNYVYIPYFDTMYYQYTDNRKHLSVLKVDKDTYLPMVFEEGEQYVVVPVYEYETEKITNPDGSSTVRYKTNEDGKFIIKADEKGKPKVLREEKRLIFSTKTMLDNNKLVDIPLIRAIRTYDPDQWIAQELIVANTEFNAAESPWVKYGYIAVAGLTIIGCILVAWFTMQHMDGQVDKVVQALSSVGSLPGKAVSGVAANLPNNVTPPPH